MTQYLVSGMSCAACSARVEKAVSGVPGVTQCSVSLLTNSMRVDGTALPQEIIAAVQAAGYQAAEKGTNPKDAALPGAELDLEKQNISTLKKRLLCSLGFLIVLMYFSMGHRMFGWPLPAFFQDNPVAEGLSQMLLTTIVMVINQRFFISGFNSLRHRAPNMDTLVALGSTAAFVYSTYTLFAMTHAQAHGDISGALSRMNDLYFESAAMILTLITVGKLLEARSKGKTTDALKSLLELTPKTATVIRDGKQTVIPVEEIACDDIFVVYPAQSIPVDAVVLEGTSAVNESALTGESIPVDKQPGSRVFAATINQSGFLRCRAVRIGKDTTFSQIIQMVSDAAATKAPIAKIADRVSAVFVPVVLAIALVTAVVWLFLAHSVGYALARGISVLVISCPCALGLATPVAIMVSSGVGAKNGILFKTAAALEETGRIRIVALDKTGTITTGAPSVTDVYACGDEKQLLQLALNIEARSEHPLARAILARAHEHNLSPEEVTDFRVLPGNGLTALYHGQTLCAGSLRYIRTCTQIPQQVQSLVQNYAAEGKTPLLFCLNDRLIGVIAVADTIKQDSPSAVRELRNMGIHVVMLTGDNKQTAEAVGRASGVDQVIAEVLPGEKQHIIRELGKQGRVAMVGDGINDAPALTQADVGIAIGAGTDVAIDAADVVLMKSSLMDVSAAIRLSRASLRIIHENLFWAFFYNSIGIPLAAGVFTGLGLTLNPMFGAAAMSLSSFCVVSNALRLNCCKIHDARRDRRKKNAPPEPVRIIREIEKGENKQMKKTIRITGMMCGHCEATVKKTLEALGGVSDVAVSHETGTATITAADFVEDGVLRQAIEEKGYTVTEII